MILTLADFFDEHEHFLAAARWACESAHACYPQLTSQRALHVVYDVGVNRWTNCNPHVLNFILDESLEA